MAQNQLERPPTTGQKSSQIRNDPAFQRLVDQITDCAIFLLTPSGEVTAWNRGAQHIKGYKPHEIIFKHFRNFYNPEAQAAQIPEQGLKNRRHYRTF